MFGNRKVGIGCSVIDIWTFECTFDVYCFGSGYDVRMAICTECGIFNRDRDHLWVCQFPLGFICYELTLLDKMMMMVFVRGTVGEYIAFPLGVPPESLPYHYRIRSLVFNGI